VGEKTGIQWTDRTWNPWQGCARVSPGCDNCYMFRDMRRYGKNPDVVVRSAAQTFNKPLRWERERVAELEANARNGITTPTPLVFLASWSDFFIREADPWRDEAWATIAKCPSLVFQILTKRHGRIRGHLPDGRNAPAWLSDAHPDGYPNVALGVTCEDQEWAERRWEAVADVPARWRFVSHEPALGQLSIARMTGNGKLPLPDWIITGGESNPGARPYHFEWARDLVEQGSAVDVPIFVKQGGDFALWGGERLRLEPHGGEMGEWPEDVRVRQFPAAWGER
jgi:protein gp37